MPPDDTTSSQFLEVTVISERRFRRGHNIARRREALTVICQREVTIEDSTVWAAVARTGTKP